MKKSLVRLLLIAFTLSIIMIPKTTVIAHDADGVYYVPSIVEYGIGDYRNINLYYKQIGAEARTDEKINKPVSKMVVTSNNQTATDGQIINSTVGKPITIDFSQSISSSAPIAEVGLQITNGTGVLTDWSSLPNGSSSATAYASQYPFSWGAASFTPTQPGTYTIYGEVRADINKSEIYEHWDAWSDNGSQATPDTVIAHNSAPSGYNDGIATYNGSGWVKNYPVTWHFEKVTVNVAEATGTVKVYYVTQNADGTLTQVKTPIEIVVPLGTTITSDGINIVTLHFPDGTSKTLEVPVVTGYEPVKRVEISDYEKYVVK